MLMKIDLKIELKKKLKIDLKMESNVHKLNLISLTKLSRKLKQRVLNMCLRMQKIYWTNFTNMVKFQSKNRLSKIE